MRERIEVRAGEVAKARTVWIEGLVDHARCIPEQLGAVGPMTSQCILSSSGPQFIEVNGRAGGGLPLAIEAGSGSADLLIEMGLDVSSGDGWRARPGCYMTRFDDHFFSDGLPAFDEDDQ